MTTFHSMLGAPSMPCTAATVTGTLYSALYLAMDPFAGLIASGLIALSYTTAYLFSQSNENAVIIAIAIHLTGWVIQFYGHFVHERRAPALFDNLFQALFQAPFFVLLELMFQLGYRKDLSKRIYDNAERDIAAWKESKKDD
eukprot:m.42459 g.42459  ORF g.42459 m.42459 type:complete len:142 (-) comp7059_c0_seq1:892-1317(-)